MMKSSLHIESEQGIGSVFSFTLIITSTAQPKVPTEHNTNIVRYRINSKINHPQLPTIIIADDVDSNRFFLASLLKTKGYICYQAQNGSRKHSRYVHVTYKPKEILLDIVMPIMDGVECAKKIREYCTEHDIVQPFITAVTAGIIGALPQEMKYDYSIFDAIIHKPIDVKELWTLLQNNSINYSGNFGTSSVQQLLIPVTPMDYDEFLVLRQSPYFSEDIAESIEFQEFEDCIRLIENLHIPDDAPDKQLWMKVIDYAKNQDAFFFVKLSALFMKE
jgi:CheY-like chemotaxis protein